MSEKTELAVLFKNIHKGLKTYSVKELNKAIVEYLNKKPDITNKEDIDFVLLLVCEEYNVTKRILINSTGRGKIQQAREIAYCLLHFDLGLTLRYIAKRIFFKWHNTVAISCRHLKNVNVNLKPEKEFKDKYDFLQKKLFEYLTKKSTK